MGKREFPMEHTAPWDCKSFDVLVITAVILAFAFVGWRAAQDALSAAVNTAVLLCMALFLFAGLGRLFNRRGVLPLQCCTADLRTLAGRLNNGESWSQIIEAMPHSFESSMLKEALVEMEKASNALYVGDQSYYRCDVADYVNEDLLNEIGNAGFNDFVSNVMTGLGILGTFVGLAIGLQSFDTQSAEAMTNSIAPLIEGIKVAFYTSIFGVALSLIYGTLYRRRMAQANQALVDFTSAFYRHVSQRSDNEAISRLLQFQESQTQSMSQFAEEFSLALSNVLEQSPVLASLPQRLSEAMAQSMLPTMSGIQASFEETTQRLTKDLSAAQADGVGTIVTQFVGQMKELMGGQMEELQTAIQSICTFEETTIAKLSEAVTAVCDNSANLAKINRSLSDTVERLEQYVRRMDESQTAQSQRIEQTVKTVGACSEAVETLANELAEILERSGEIMGDISTMAVQMQKQEQEISGILQAQKTALKESTAALQGQAKDMKTSYGNAVKSFEQISQKLLLASDRLSKDMDEAMERTYAQFDQQLATALERFSGTLAELREITERIPQAVIGSASKMRQQQLQFSQQFQQSVAKLSKLLQQNEQKGR